MLRLQGSTTVGEKLTPALVKAFLAKRGATDVQETSSDGDSLIVITGTVPGRGPLRFEIRPLGTEKGFAGLRDGSTDVAMASRRITDVERDQLRDRGDLTSPASEQVLALDAVAAIVNQASPVTQLTVDQLRQIFACQITDWAQLVPGSPTRPIRVLARDDNSGTWETFRDRVLANTPLCAKAQRFATNDELAEAVTQDQAAIGFVALPSVGATRALALHDGTARPLAPTTLSVSTESYVLTRRIYFYLPATPSNPLAREFAEEFALSKEGQQVVTTSGFVSTLYPPAAPPDTHCTESPPTYCEAITHAERVPVDIRFASGGDTVDNRAIHNLDLLAQQLTAPGGHRQVLLLGFAGAIGSADHNVPLSIERATAVQRYLTSRGVTDVVVMGYGDAQAVASNDTPQGQEQNRRVEVWLR